MRRASIVRRIIFLIAGAGLGSAVLANSWLAAIASDAPERALMFRPSHPPSLLARAEAILQAEEARSAAIAAGTALPASGATRDRWVIPRDVADRSSGADLKADASRTPQVERPRSPEEERAAEVAARDRLLVDVATKARLVLAQRPGDPQALRILGVMALDAKDAERAATFLRAAAERSLREAPALAWLVEEAARKNDWQGLVQRADALIRMHPRYTGALIPAFARMAEHPEAGPVLRAAVLQNPPWRSRLIGEMGNHVTDARTPLSLLLALRETSAPPTTPELGAYLAFLLRKGQVDVAYYTWLQFLPPEELSKVGYLYNGSFETPPSGLPFDWVIPSRGTATIEIARRRDRPAGRALVIEMRQGRIEFAGISQLVRLVPGRYRFASEGMGEIGGTRGFRWRIECASGRRERLGETGMLLGKVQAWRPYTIDFTVPLQDCPVQTVRLDLDARMHSERLVTGTAWFDELAITRLPAESQALATTGTTTTPSPQSQPRQR